MSNWVGLLALDRWVSSARLAEAMQASGLRVAAFCRPRSPLAATRYVDQLVLVEVKGLLAALEQFCSLRRPAALVPCDERAVRMLHGLSADPATSTDLRDLIRRSLGDPNGYAVAISKWATYALANGLGLRVPRQRLVGSLDEALGFASAEGYPVILKREGTYGGAGCRICGSERDILAAYRGLLANGWLQKAMGRAEAWVGWRGWDAARPAERLIIQRFHEGQLAFIAAVARDGAMLAGLAATAEHVHPQPIGASTVVRLRDAPDLLAVTETLMRQLGYSGFVGVDFIIERSSGLAYLLEINPRVTPLVALGRRLGSDLCAAFAERFAGAPPPRPAARRATVAALFPNEWLRDPASPYLVMADHDVPLRDPGLMAWIYRDLPARRRFMLQWGMLQCAGFERGWRRGGEAGSLAGRPAEPIELARAPNPHFGSEAG